MGRQKSFGSKLWLKEQIEMGRNKQSDVENTQATTSEKGKRGRKPLPGNASKKAKRQTREERGFSKAWPI